MASSVFQPELCPTGNLCDRTVMGGPACGSTFDHLSPRPLVEQLCPEALSHQIELEQQNVEHMHVRPGKANYRLASAYLELALTQAPGGEQAIEAFEDTDIYLERTIESCDPESNREFDVLISAKRLRAHLPFFKARQAQRDFTPQHLKRLHEETGELLSEVQTLADSRGDRRTGLQIKLATQALFLRCGEYFYMGTARESYGFSPQNSPYNHDGYFIHQGEKIPIKVKKTDDRRDRIRRSESILFMPYMFGVLDCNDALPQPQQFPEDEDIFEGTFDILKLEALGERITTAEREFMDGLSDWMQGHVKDYIRSKAGES